MVLDHFAGVTNSSEPDQARQNVHLDLDPNCLTPKKIIFQKSRFGKKSADHVRIQRGGGGQGVWAPLENYKNIGFLSNTGPDPLKITKLSRAIIGPPMKRHLNGVSLGGGVGGGGGVDGPLIVVFGSFLPSSNRKKRRQSWTPSDKFFWI